MDDATILLDKFDRIITLTRIKCDCCGRLLDPYSDEFLIFLGNVEIPNRGGIIGNNFKEDGTLGNITIICRHGCLEETFKGFFLPKKICHCYAGME